MTNGTCRMAGAILASTTILLAAAACAGRASVGGSDQSGPDTSRSGVVSSGPLSPGGASSQVPTPNVVSPEPAVGLRRERWTRVEPVAGAPEALIYATLSGGPPCTVLGRVEVTETQDHVTLTLWVGQRAGAQCEGAQPQLGYPLVTRVRLAAPIANRDVRDGAA